MLMLYDQSKSKCISSGWEYCDGELGGPWAAWRETVYGGTMAVGLNWQAVSVPHCATAEDCVDPDQPYSQHPGWYGINLDCSAADPDEHLVLEFGGLGQTGEIYIDMDCVYRQDLAYDAFSVDITDTVTSWREDWGLEHSPPGETRLGIGLDVQAGDVIRLELS